MHEGERLSAKLLEKAYFIFKQVSSDKWKAPLVNAVSSVANELESGVNNN